jgi:hypothetical protein
MLVAIVAVVISLTAPGYAAQLVRTVFFAKKAGNAQKVDGLRASKTPRPNTLLALDSQGKLPSSVGAVGPRGPQGVQGPHGVQGPQGVQGLRGAAGAPGSALADGVIVYSPPDGPSPWGTDDAYSKNIDNSANFIRKAAGVYCVYGLPFNVMNAVATPGPFGGKGAFLVQTDVPRFGHAVDARCPTNTTNAIIYVTDPTGMTLEDPPDSTDTIFFSLN